MVVSGSYSWSLQPQKLYCFCGRWGEGVMQQNPGYSWWRCISIPKCSSSGKLLTWLYSRTESVVSGYTLKKRSHRKVASLNNVAYRRPQPCPWPNCSCDLAHWLVFQGKSHSSGLLFLTSGCDFLLTSPKPCNKAISGYFSNPPLPTSKEKTRSQCGDDLSWAGQLYLCYDLSPIWGV